MSRTVFLKIYTQTKGQSLIPSPLLPKGGLYSPLPVHEHLLHLPVDHALVTSKRSSWNNNNKQQTSWTIAYFIMEGFKKSKQNNLQIVPLKVLVLVLVCEFFYDTPSLSRPLTCTQLTRMGRRTLTLFYDLAKMKSKTETTTFPNS